MPKKKSAKKAAQEFQALAKDLDAYCSHSADAGLSDQEKTWLFEGSLIKLAAAFDRLMLNLLVAAINNETEKLSKTTGVKFPKHLTDEVCEFIVTGGGYFDYRGRDGLLRTLKSFLVEDHYLVKTVRKGTYKQTLNRFIALRNFAAHGSPQSKRAAREAGGTNLSSAGAWLKRQQRFTTISEKLRQLAAEVESSAPY